jgi:hypothetical protein
MSDSTENSGSSQEERDASAAKLENEHRNVFENIVADENVFQLIASANGHTMTARSVLAKAYATQCMGDISDTTIQQISADRGGISKKGCSNQHPQPGNFSGLGRKIG